VVAAAYYEIMAEAAPTYPSSAGLQLCRSAAPRRLSQLTNVVWLQLGERRRFVNNQELRLTNLVPKVNNGGFSLVDNGLPGP
jgi:hypothetical protein